MKPVSSFTRNIIAFLALVAIVIPGRAYAKPKQTFAYMLLDNSAVTQYRVDQSGKFIPLNPPVFHTGNDYAHKLLVHPNGKYVYIIEGGALNQCKINPDGTLALRKIIRYTGDGGACDGMIDKSGKYLYIAGAGCGHALLQYKIGKDGLLTLVKGKNEKSDTIGYHLVLHPTLPYLYKATAHSPEDRSPQIHIFRLNGNKEPSFVATADMGGPMAVSNDGSNLYCAAIEAIKMVQYKIAKDGTLTQKNSLNNWGYIAGPWSDENSRVLMQNSDILITRSGKTVFVSDSYYGGLHRFDLTSNGEIKFVNSYWIEKGKLISDKDIYARIKDGLSKQTPPVTDTESINKAYNTKVDSILILDQPCLIAEGPDGSLYAAGKSSIVHFMLGSDGSIKTMKPAYIFSKSWWKKYRRSDGLYTYPCSLLIVQR